MANLRSDSHLSRHIASAFLDFLRTVKPASDDDIESIEVITDCLQAVFKLNSPSTQDRTSPNFLVDMFTLLEAEEEAKSKAELGVAEASSSAVRVSSAHMNDKGKVAEEPISVGEGKTGVKCAGDVSNDELFGQFCGALEKIHFFKATPTGDDDHIQLTKAKLIFDEALAEAEKPGNHVTDIKSVAEILKMKGNHAMQSKSYADAIEFYTCAIALNENNAIYYCNRAAAFTQIHKYAEAIADCKKSIWINPNYSKAYSRLGMAYYALGNYSDAINFGYLKALELDPNNDSIRENIRVAEQRLSEEFQRLGDQNTEASHRQEANNHSGSENQTGGASSFAFGTNFPAEFANAFLNMAANAYSSQNGPERPGNVASGGSNEPGIGIGGNISVNVGDDVPEEVTGALRSVMEMFSSSQPSQGNGNRG